MNKIHILYHKDSDGRFAGFCAHHYFTRSDFKDPKHPYTVTAIGVQYNEPLPFNIDDLKPGDFVHIVDFSYPREILDQIYEKIGPRLKVLDHHIKAEEGLRGAPYVIFDNTKSGALLAWEYYFPDIPTPKACLLVNDRDLWRWEFGEDTANFESYLRTMQVNDDWGHWSKLTFDDGEVDAAIERGKGFTDYERRAVKSFASSSRNIQTLMVSFNDQTIKAAFYEGMGILTSEVGEEFYKNHGFDATIEHRIRGDKMVFSMRSNTQDVGDLAKAMPGGGGHKAAAGFSMPLIDGLRFISTMYEHATSEEKFIWGPRS